MGKLSRSAIKGYALSFLLAISFDANAKQCGGLFDLEESRVRVQERLVAQAESKTEVRLDRVKIGTYNLLNLFIHQGNIHKNTKVHAKPLWATEQLAKTLKEEDYDIFVAQEVESIRSAHIFNKKYLDNQYQVFTTTTRDVRGLYVVFFVKKALPFHYKLESHDAETWFDPVRNKEASIFERDLPVLHIYKNEYDKKPLLTMLGVHFKSKRHRQGVDGQIDFESNILRTAQANRATQIIQRYQIEYGYEHPILIAGDFNSNHNYAPEYTGFYRHAKLRDTLGLKSRVLSIAERASHSYFGDAKATRHNQLDGILITPVLEQFLIKAYIVKYRDYEGNQRDIPRTKFERKSNPSDHRPITAIFDLRSLSGEQ